MNERPTPIILAAIPVIKSLLQNATASSEDVKGLLDLCRQHGQAWNGLGIVECADESLEHACKEIYESWQKKGS